MKENIEEKEEKLISTVSDATNSGFLENVPSQINSIKPEENTVVNLNLIQDDFKITPQELTNIVNKYKERDENMQDIKYFQEKNGIDFLLDALGLCQRSFK